MIRRLYLHHFRNYTKQEISFSPGVNWIVGKNAQGKTNLLEALYFLTTGRSFRTTSLSQLIQTGASFFYLEAEIEKEGVIQTLKVSFDGENKKVQYNASTYAHFTPLIGLLPHVIYAPDDINLVTGAPSFRRKFLDVHLSQIDPLYLHHLARYHKAMRQRNELLKKKSEVAIDAWEMSMAISAAYLIEMRAHMIEELKGPLQSYMEILSGGKDHLSIEYHPSIEVASADKLSAVWLKNRKKELHIGATLTGPHRDDVEFLIEGLSAKSFASVGQKHTILSALRLCQWDHFRQSTGEVPIMSIDDFGSHLDRDRQELFQSNIQDLGQIFLTSPMLYQDVFPNKQVLEVGLGQVLEKGRA